MYRNQHTWRKFWYLINKSNGEPIKKRHFQSFRSVFGVKYQLSHLESDFLLKIIIRWTTFMKNFFHFNHFLITLFNKNMPNFRWLTNTLMHDFRFSLRMLILIQNLNTLGGWSYKVVNWLALPFSRSYCIYFLCLCYTPRKAVMCT